MFKQICKAVSLLVITALLTGLTLQSSTTTTARTESGNLISDASSSPSGVPPRLAFCDLISGPDTGIGDGLGSGVIVTCWGQNLGSSQGGSSITFTDSGATERTPYVYYWKNADGALPGGPANLYESHEMQEIAFSIPDSATGAGTIRVTAGGEVSNTLPFTVRSGDIYHVKTAGNDTTGDGSFANPFETFAHAQTQMGPGDILYISSVDIGTQTPTGLERPLYFNTSAATSTLDAQLGLIVYPGSAVNLYGTFCHSGYNTDAIVVAKFACYASNKLSVDVNGQPSNSVHSSTAGMQSTKNGRVVANYITDLPGGCSDAQGGALTGSYQYSDNISNAKFFGNEVENYGCAGTNKLHHTTYVTIRNYAATNPQIPPWEFGWNYLHDNDAKNGIHNYDQDDNCGSTTGPVIIHDNVIVNQGGGGITIGASGCDWTQDFHVYNNVVINAGLASSWDGVDPSTTFQGLTNAINVHDSGLLGHVYIYNNTVYNWDEQNVSAPGSCIGLTGSGADVSVTISYNTCMTDSDKPFWKDDSSSGGLSISGSSNSFYSSASSPVNAVVPSWASGSITANPLLTQNGSQLEIDVSSPILGQVSSPIYSWGVYGTQSGSPANVGAIQ